MQILSCLAARSKSYDYRPARRGPAQQVTLCDGKVHDATAFEPPMLEETKRVLASYGFHPSGKEKMRNGRTGRELDCMIFCTPIEMNRLHHIASIKAASRNTGPNTLRERQPVEGRSKGEGNDLGNGKECSYNARCEFQYAQPALYCIGRAKSGVL